MIDRRRFGRLLAAAALAAVAAPTAGAQGPLFATLGEARAAMFVLEDFLDGDASIGEIARLYADTVEYFDKGALKRAEILDIRRNFLSRWSSRSYAPDLSTLVVRRDGENRYVVQIEVDFTVQNAAAQVAGRSLVDLTVVERGDAFEVVREGGRVIVQR